MITLKLNKTYELIRTNIQFSRGLNGIDFVTYKNAKVIEVKDNAAKIVEWVEVDSDYVNSDYSDKGYYKISCVDFDTITQAVIYQERTRYMIRIGAIGRYCNLTEEEYRFNIERGINLTRA